MGNRWSQKAFRDRGLLWERKGTNKGWGRCRRNNWPVSDPRALGSCVHVGQPIGKAVLTRSPDQEGHTGLQFPRQEGHRKVTAKPSL